MRGASSSRRRDSIRIRGSGRKRTAPGRERSDSPFDMTIRPKEGPLKGGAPHAPLLADPRELAPDRAAGRAVVAADHVRRAAPHGAVRAIRVDLAAAARGAIGALPA